MWESFKTDIKRIAKDHAKMSTHKINAKMRMLQENRRNITATDNFEHNEMLQTEEALLANKIMHLERSKAKTHKEIFRVKRNNHGEKLGGIWSLMSKKKKPRDPIYRLKIPNSNPPQYGRSMKQMAKLA
jgi:hypothetical protein